MMARFRFFSAPATISEAEADSDEINTAIGNSRSPPSLRASFGSRSVPLTPTVVTITPSSTNASLTWMACSSRPPGLPRRSSTRPFSVPPFCCFMARIAPSMSRVVVPENPESRTYPTPLSSSLETTVSYVTSARVSSSFFGSVPLCET